MAHNEHLMFPTDNSWVKATDLLSETNTRKYLINYLEKSKIIEIDNDELIDYKDMTTEQLRERYKNIFLLM